MTSEGEAEMEFEKGSGNVFEDLGFEDADERFARAKLGFCVYRILKDKELKQREIASLLGIKQPEVSHLMNGHFNRFTTDKLLDFLNRLDRKVTFQISLRRSDEPYQKIEFSPGSLTPISPDTDFQPAPKPERSR